MEPNQSLRLVRDADCLKEVPTPDDLPYGLCPGCRLLMYWWEHEAAGVCTNCYFEEIDACDSGSPGSASGS